MTQNIFTFGDLTFKHLNGTAMGTPPVPPYATVYYGIHEEKLLPRYTQCIIFYHQFDRIPSTTPGAEPPRDVRDSGSARSHSTHLETSSS